MNISEYSKLDGLGLADVVRRREASAGEIHQIAREAMLAADEHLHFLVGETPAEAERALDGLIPDAPFAGVPTLAKDIGPRIAGVLQEMGSELARGMTSDTDSEIVRRYRAAGLICMGRTATPEFGASFTTEPRVGPSTRNPWETSHSPGGSSGGAAAAVSAGVVPIALGGDSAGSIRIPSHCCGLFGLKPSRGRNPTGPESAEVNSGLTVAHVLARTVRDSAAMLDATAGADPGCRYACAPPSRPFLETAGLDPKPLRIAVSTRNVFGGSVDGEVREAAHEAGRLCESLGHSVEESDPPLDGDELVDVLCTIWCANIHHLVRHLERRTGRQASADTLEAPTLALFEEGQRVSSDALLRSFDLVNAITRRLAQFFDRYDVLLTPSFAATAPRLGALQPGRIPDARSYVQESMAAAPFTPQFNVTGQPAMSVPLHQSSDGLPIGAHFAATYGDEETLFALAGQLERAAPWVLRVPPTHVSTIPISQLAPGRTE